MNKGDIVLIPFPFSDLLGNKIRQAIILIVSRLDVTVCFISSNTNYPEPFDFILESISTNRLKMRSLVKLNKISTVNKELILGKIGELSVNEHYILDTNLRKIFNL